VFLALAPLALAVALVGWVLMLVWFRYVSLASVTAAVLLPAAVWLTERSGLLAWVTTALGLIAIARHHQNLRRLWQGTEPRVEWGKRA
jgi:glycerol-3-phosphate acyltransferase PlsY